MRDFGINLDDFNPRIFYILRRKFNVVSDINYHSHDFISLTYILSGTCTYYIEGKSYRVKKGNLILCNPGIMHGKTLCTSEEINEFHIGFSNICIENLPRDHIISREASPVITFAQYEQEFFKCCSDILAEQEKNDVGCALMLKSLVMKLIVILLKEIYKQETHSDENIINLESYDKISVVNAVVTYINENYMQDVSLDKISKSMYLSPVYISKIFKEEIGESPINYLIKVRLSKAVELMKDSNKPIKEVAKSIGYDDAYYFSKLFKKYYGFSPLKYKNMNL